MGKKLKILLYAVIAAIVVCALLYFIPITVKVDTTLVALHFGDEKPPVKLVLGDDVQLVLALAVPPVAKSRPLARFSETDTEIAFEGETAKNRISRFTSLRSISKDFICTMWSYLKMKRNQKSKNFMPRLQQQPFPKPPLPKLYHKNPFSFKSAQTSQARVRRQSECTPAARRGLHSLCRSSWLH